MHGGVLGLVAAAGPGVGGGERERERGLALKDFRPENLFSKPAAFCPGVVEAISVFQAARSAVPFL